MSDRLYRVVDGEGETLLICETEHDAIEARARRMGDGITATVEVYERAE